MLADLDAAKLGDRSCPTGFREGVCGAFKVLREPARFGGTDYYFDASNRLIGRVDWSDIALPCDTHALDPNYRGPLKPGQSLSTEIGVIPKCEGIWTKEYCADTPRK